MPKIRAGKCVVCQKPVYDLTGKDIPDYLQEWTAKYQDYLSKMSDKKYCRHRTCQKVK